MVKNITKLSLCLAIFSIVSVISVSAQQTQNFTTAGTYSFTVPPGVTSITVQCYGGGGGGARATQNNTGRGGGGGGAFASSTIAVTPLTSYTVVVGAGGGSNGNGNPSSFGGTTVVAVGGTGGTDNTDTGGQGGQLAACTGMITNSGGRGADGSGGNSGGGGGGAGSGLGNNGGDGSGMTAGAGGAGNVGGTGGAGRNSDGVGNGGSAYGGGGGGGRRGSGIFATNRNGGNGAPGAVLISWAGSQPAWCIATGSTSASTYINDFTTTGGVTNINNIGSGYTSPGHIAFNQTVTQYSGQSVGFTITLVGGTVGAAIWVDWNQNGTFETTERMYNTTAYGNGPFTSSFIVPTTALAGTTKMRVNVNYNSNNPADPCIAASGTRGETEDYIFEVRHPDYRASFANVNSGGSWCAGETRNVTIDVANIGAQNWAGQNVNLLARWDNGSWVTGPVLTNVSGNTTNYTVSMTAPAAGAHTLSFDLVKQGDCFFSNNDGSCGPGNAIHTTSSITVNQLPIVNAGTDISICSPPVTLNGSADGGMVTGTTTAQNNITGTTTQDNGTTEVGITIAGAPAGATITGITFTPRVQVEYCTFPTAFGCFATAYGNCTNYNSWVKMQYWNGSTWVDIANCNTSMSISSFNGNVANGTVVKIRTVDVDGTIDNVRTYLENVTVNWEYPQPVTYLWSPATDLSATNIANPVSSTTTTRTYTLEGTIPATGCRATDDVTITIDAPAATLTTANMNRCHGNSVALGGNVTASGAWTLNSGHVVTGTGNGSWGVTVNPNTTTTYSIASLTGGACPGSISGSTIVTLPVTSNTLAGNSDNATCVVNAGETVHFYHSSGRYIASVTANATGLGNTTATAFIDSPNPVSGQPINTQACDDPGFVTAVLGRHWTINPTTNVSATVRLPYYNDELTWLYPASTASSNPNDNLSSQGALGLSKYSGPNNVNNLWADNCIATGGNAGTTWQAPNGSGDVSAYITGFPTDRKYSLFNISGFSEFWLHASNPVSPLAVTLTNFSASCEDNETNISWSTASEQNSDYFILERSRDGYNWNTVAKVDGAGTTNATTNYSVTDSKAGEVYYRLRQFDFDGANETFGPIIVDCSNENNELIVYPNPNGGNFTVALNTTEAMGESTVFVQDLNGKVVSQRDLNVLSGTNTVHFEGDNLVKGTYIVSVKGKDNKTFIPVRLIIQ